MKPTLVIIVLIALNLAQVIAWLRLRFRSRRDIRHLICISQRLIKRLDK